MSGSTEALRLVERERWEHFEAGHSFRNDDRLTEGQLLHAALAYLCTPGDSLWPFEPERFHQSQDPVVNVVKAGALLVAEGDRLLRARRFGMPAVSGMIVLGMSPDYVASVVDGLREVHRTAQELKNL